MFTSSRISAAVACAATVIVWEVDALMTRYFPPSSATSEPCARSCSVQSSPTTSFAQSAFPSTTNSTDWCIGGFTQRKSVRSKDASVRSDPSPHEMIGKERPDAKLATETVPVTTSFGSVSARRPRQPNTATPLWDERLLMQRVVPAASVRSPL